MSWHAWYREYLKTPRWQGIRRRALDRAGKRCERCGSDGRLEVHHKHYQSLNDERIGDIEVLCPTCHVIADGERAATSGYRGVRTGYETWLRKRDAEDSLEEHDRFQEWLEDRRS